MALVQEPRPHAGPVGRVREQARHRRRGGAIATSAPARALDHARVRLDRHLDQFRRVGAVRHIRFPAIGADALVRRGVLNFRALFETRPSLPSPHFSPGRLSASKELMGFTSLTAMSMIVPMADCAGRALAGLLAPCTRAVYTGRVHTGRARTCSLNRRPRYAFGREHAHVPVCTQGQNPPRSSRPLVSIHVVKSTVCAAPRQAARSTAA